MKKLFIVGALTALASVGAFAQGYVSSSSLGTSFTITTNGTGIGASSGTLASSANSGFGYYFELLVGSSSMAQGSSALTSGWTDSGVTFTNKSAGGLNSVSSIAISSAVWNAGVSNAYIIVGWSANMGTSWSAVQSELTGGTTPNTYYYGYSTVGYGIAGAASPGTPFHLFGAAGASGVPINSGMVLTGYTVPEPGTMALAALGGASLLMFRRKK